MSNVIILVGVPGSGKSTLAIKELPDYIRISQDQLGSRDACEKAMKHALQYKKNVVIDRTNINKKQRSYFIKIAKQYGVTNIIAIYLEEDKDACVSRIHARQGHETIKENLSLDEKRNIVYNFSKSFEMPSLNEGFKSVVITKGIINES